MLWVVLAINATMFAVEVIAGLAAGSASLQADALDFLGDAGNYVISLLVVGMAPRYRAFAAALLKGATMGVFGLWVLGSDWLGMCGMRHYRTPATMGIVGLAALLAQCSCRSDLLWAYRDGDANMRSAWVCTRNDVLGNLAVLLAAVGVFGTGTGLAGRGGGRDHGEPCSPRSVDGGRPGTRRASKIDRIAASSVKPHRIKPWPSVVSRRHSPLASERCPVTLQQLQGTRGSPCVSPSWRITSLCGLGAG